jgi:hypothetical protein
MNDSTSATAATFAATSAELPILAEYRTISKAAVAALLLGLASAVALANPVLAIIPLAAIVMSVLAFRSIASAAVPMSGRRLAVAGLCLAALFLGWGLARHFHHQLHVRAKAREFADDWLRVLATGDRPRAFQLHVAREFRQDPRSIKKRMSINKDEPDVSMSGFFEEPALEKFLAAGTGVSYQFEEVVLQTRDGLSDFVVLRYTFQGPQERESLWVTVRRTFSNVHRSADWELYSATHLPP